MDPSLLPVTDHVKPLPLTPEVTGHVIGNGIIVAITLLIVAGRFICRTFLGAGLGIDDWLILASLILSVGTYGITVTMSIAGAGHPTPDVAMLGNLPHILLMTFIMVITSLVSLALSKLSMLFFYMRVFEEPRMRLYCWLTMGATGLWFFAIFFGNLFICKPIAAQFDLTLAKPDSCGNQIPVFQAMIIVNILIDIAIMVLPMRIIWSLNMRKTEKVGLMTSFMLLLGVVIVGVVRIQYVSTVDMRSNLTATMPVSIFLAAIELNMSIICVSIPMLRPLYSRYRAKRSASKLTDETPQDGSDLQTYGGSGGKGGSAKNSRHRAAGPAVDITLNTFHDRELAKGDEYGVGGVTETAVDVGSGRSLDESERCLTDGPVEKAIGVHTKWEVRRE